MQKVDYIQTTDCLEGLRTLADHSVQCCVTSPPYFRLRDYGVSGQIGMEQTPQEYVRRLVGVFSEVRRILTDDGTLWLNLGDSYWNGSAHRVTGGVTHDGSPDIDPPAADIGLKSKDLIGIPWAVAVALRDSGWYLRQDIIWSKQKAMPEPVTDRCTRSHEYIFMLTKSAQYYYDHEAIKTNRSESSVQRDSRGIGDKNKYAKDIGDTAIQSLNRPRPNLKQAGHGPRHAGFAGKWRQSVRENGEPPKANRRSVWTLSPAHFREAHYATFPLELPALCIKAGSREGDIILDPFCGAGTTAVAAAMLGRHYIGFDLNSRYVKIAERRLYKAMGLFYRGT